MKYVFEVKIYIALDVALKFYEIVYYDDLSWKRNMERERSMTKINVVNSTFLLLLEYRMRIISYAHDYFINKKRKSNQKLYRIYYRRDCNTCNSMPVGRRGWSSSPSRPRSWVPSIRRRQKSSPVYSQNS